MHQEIYGDVTENEYLNRFIGYSINKVLELPFWNFNQITNESNIPVSKDWAKHISMHLRPDQYPLHFVGCGLPLMNQVFIEIDENGKITKIFEGDSQN